MKPLFKWSGGKRDEIVYIQGWYPKNYQLYIEPFFGGGAIFFDLKPKNAVISDIHKDLINFLKQIQKGKSKEIYKLMTQYPNDEKIYYEIRDEFKPKNNVEKAFVFYYLRKTAYRGMLRYNSKGKFNIPYGRYKKINFDDLFDESYHQLLINKTILNKDFRSIFKKYNNKNNFVFLDPPYDSTFKNYGFYNFNQQDHVDLAYLFKKTKNKCLLIIGDTDFTRNLYKKYIKADYNKKYSFKLHDNRINNSINKKHLIITNY